MKSFFLLLSVLFSYGIYAAEEAIVTSSSVEGGIASYSPAKVLDGDLRTRWSSEPSSPQELSIELPHKVKLESLELNWEKAYAKHYSIRVSSNGTNWMTVFTQKNKLDASMDRVKLKRALGVKFIQFNFIQASGQYGSSLFEIKFNDKFYNEIFESEVSAIVSSPKPVAKEIEVQPEAAIKSDDLTQLSPLRVINPC